MKRFAISLLAPIWLAAPAFAQTTEKASIDKQLADLREAHNANVAAIKALAADVKELAAKFDKLNTAQTTAKADPFDSPSCVNGVCIPESQGKWIGNIWHNNVNGAYVPGMHPTTPGVIYGVYGNGGILSGGFSGGACRSRRK